MIYHPMFLCRKTKHFLFALKFTTPQRHKLPPFQQQSAATRHPHNRIPHIMVKHNLWISISSYSFVMAVGWKKTEEKGEFYVCEKEIPIMHCRLKGVFLVSLWFIDQDNWWYIFHWISCLPLIVPFLILLTNTEFLLLQL